MLFTLLNVIAWLVLLGLLWWLVGKLPLPASIKQIVNVVFIILAILILLSVVGLFNMNVPTLIRG